MLNHASIGQLLRKVNQCLLRLVSIFWENSGESFSIRLTRNVLEMAVKAFNNCIIPDKNHGPNDEEFCITFIYEFIDDDYSMTNWLPEPSAGTSLEGSLTGATGTSPTDNAAESDKGSLRDSVNAYGEKKVYVEEDRFTGRKPYVCAEAKKYSESTKTLIKNHPLSVMVSQGHLMFR